MNTISFLDKDYIYKELEDLVPVCREVANHYWGLDWNVPIKINHRLIDIYGYYISDYIRDKNGKVIGRKPNCIEISLKAFNDFNGEQMLDLLKHELCHWACEQMGKPNGDGTVFFESELRRIGTTSSGFDMLNEPNYKEKSWAYQESIINKKYQEEGKIEHIWAFAIYNSGRLIYKKNTGGKRWIKVKQRSIMSYIHTYKRFFLLTFEYNGQEYYTGIGLTHNDKWEFKQDKGCGIYSVDNEEDVLWLTRKARLSLKKIIIKDLVSQLPKEEIEIINIHNV